MKTIYSKCVLAAALALFATSAMWAAPSRVIKFQVPFAFVAGSSQLPAGNYALAEDGSQHVIYLTNEGTGATLMMLPEASVTASETTRPSVRFVKSGAQYFMQVVRIEGSQGFQMRLPQ